MQIIKANIYRLEPTEEQAIAFSQWAGACRFLFNLALEQRRDWYRPGRRFSYNQQQAEITMLRAEVDWLRAVPYLRHYVSGNASSARVPRRLIDAANALDAWAEDFLTGGFRPSPDRLANCVNDYRQVRDGILQGQP